PPDPLPSFPAKRGFFPWEHWGIGKHILILSPSLFWQFFEAWPTSRQSWCLRPKGKNDHSLRLPSPVGSYPPQIHRADKQNVPPASAWLFFFFHTNQRSFPVIFYCSDQTRQHGFDGLKKCR